MALNHRVGLKKSGQVFPRSELSTWGGLGSYVGYWTYVPLDYKKFILFTTFFPQEQRDLNSGLITVHVSTLGPQKLIKLGQIEGLIGHESSWCSGWPQPVYKVAKETPKLSNPIGRE